MLDYGIIGNCNTSALIKKDSSVDWMCFPDFDSPSIFAKILDKDKGGSFQIIPDQKCEITQEYIENTCILETTFSCKSYSFKIIDFFPRYRKLLPSRKRKLFKRNRLIRIIEPIKGTPKIKIIFNPQLNYAQDTTVTKVNGVIESKNHSQENNIQEIQLQSNIDYQDIIEQRIIEIKNRKFLALGKSIDATDYDLKTCLQLLRSTKRYWLDWVNTLQLPETYKNIIIRSALTLKLLTFSKTGAILAAATTSLPEEIGSERCWDYRFCWVRDSIQTVDALKKIGRMYEPKKLMEFFIKRIVEDRNFQIMYGINGETKLTEKTLPHLAGFKDSKPVRIGNAAFNQKQWDMYGELIDLLYLYFVYYEIEPKMSLKYWRVLSYLTKQIKLNWKKIDSGIWEFRGKLRHYTFSKLMCYIGIDRAIKIAQHFNKEQHIKKWLPLKEEIMADICKNAYDEKNNTFTMYYGGKELDASNLLMTYHEFLDNTDPRIIGTVKAIYNNLREGVLVQRYKAQDDFGKSTSAFTICSFWLIQSMYDIGEKEKAKDMFDKILKYSNHLGLFSEDVTLKGKKLTGNFPQAYSHIAIINTAILLSEWSSKRKKINWDAIKIKNLF